MSKLKPETLGPAVGMIVHDLRNPAATLRANLSFVREVADDPSVAHSELVEALEDAQQALSDVMRGLDQLSWIGRWMQGQSPATTNHEDIRESVRRGAQRVHSDRVELKLPEEAIPGRGGEALSRLVELLIVNSLAHGGPRPVRVSVSPEQDGSARIEVSDEGRALAQEFQESAWTLDGQHALKSRGDGRYSRVLGLFTARLLADAMQATLTAEGEDGRALFRVRVPAR